MCLASGDDVQRRENMQYVACEVRDVEKKARQATKCDSDATARSLDVVLKNVDKLAKILSKRMI